MTHDRPVELWNEPGDCARVAVRELSYMGGVYRWPQGNTNSAKIWRFAALGLVVLLRLPAGTPQQTLGGSPACPCIDPWPAPSAGETCRSLRINREHDFGVTNFSEVCVLAAEV